MNQILTDSLHALAKRHRITYRDSIGISSDEADRALSELQDQIKALMMDYIPDDIVKEIFDCDDLDGGMDGMTIALGSGFVLVVPI